MPAPTTSQIPDLDAVDFGRLWRIVEGRLVLLCVVDGREVIVDDERETFAELLRHHVGQEWRFWAAMRRLGEQPPMKNVRPSLDPDSAADANIAKHLRAAARGFRQRGDAEMASLLERLAERPGAPRRGRPRGSPDRFRKFLARLLWAIHFYGGRATYDRLTGKGTLITLIDELRPLLPPGFVPQWAWPPSYLERLLANSRRPVKHDADTQAVIDDLTKRLARELAA